MLAPELKLSDNKTATFWLGRWCAGCAWGGKSNRWFLRVIRSDDGRCRMLVLQTPSWACGIGHCAS